MKKIILNALLIALTLSTSASAKTKLSLGAGSMNAGGSMQMPIIIPKDGDTLVGLNFSPTFNYFVVRNFSLGFAGSVERASLTAKNLPWNFSLGLSTKYYFDLGPIYPYVGGGVAMGWKTQIEGLNFIFSAPVGVLVALNSHVALDFGVPINFYFNRDGYFGAKLPIGYLGVQAFF